MQEFENTAIDKNNNQDCKYYNTCYLQVRNNGYCFSKCKDFCLQPYKERDTKQTQAESEEI